MVGVGVWLLVSVVEVRVGLVIFRPIVSGINGGNGRIYGCFSIVGGRTWRLKMRERGEMSGDRDPPLKTKEPNTGRGEEEEEVRLVLTDFGDGWRREIERRVRERCGGGGEEEDGEEREVSTELELFTGG
ncbi:hypothetical protein HAX54_036316 [Datura stramonium]|uniref:Uncharacterized protein n=1 Tax=Datura stramonium TaxID=4076 RepID=A0ABS8RM98_DATST|nr:hypothetical protein [Datura stramonium]